MERRLIRDILKDVEPRFTEYAAKGPVAIVPVALAGEEWTEEPLKPVGMVHTIEEAKRLLTKAGHRIRHNNGWARVYSEQERPGYGGPVLFVTVHQ